MQKRSAELLIIPGKIIQEEIVESLCGVTYPSGFHSHFYKISCPGSCKECIAAPQRQSCVIFYDDNVELSYVRAYATSLSVDKIYPVSCSEKNKDRHCKEKLEDYLNQLTLDKDCTLIAIGGGILCDIVGFVAATYLAGVNLVFVPTTLLCMVDACLGGKVAVNLAPYKNRIGLFYPATIVIIDLAFLQTLPKNVLRDGTAEVVKYGCILETSLLDDLAIMVKEGTLSDRLSLSSVIKRSLLCKSFYVSADPYDKSIRRVLNFGHTAGHALEAYHSLTITHGEAVACGIVIELFISYIKGYIPIDVVIRIAGLLRGLGFDFLPFVKDLQTSEMLEFMRRDKKSRHGAICCTTLAALGRVNKCDGNFVETIADADVLKALELFKGYAQEELCQN